MAASHHIGFCRKWNMTTAKFTADFYQIWLRYVKRGRVMAIYVFSKWRPAAILDFQRSEIWRYFCFEDVGFSFWAKFCVNMCNSAWVMAIKVNLQKGGSHHPEFCRSELTLGKVAAGPYLSPCQIWLRYLEGRCSYDDLCVFKMADGRHLGF